MSMPADSRSFKELRVQEIDALTLEQFPRLQRLRQALLDAQPALCMARARLFTEYYKEHGFDEKQPLLRQARALAHTLDNIELSLFDDELIVGSTTRHRLGVPLFPEFTGMTIMPELPTISTRHPDPVSISRADADALAMDIFPYWKDRNVHEYVRREGDNPFSLQVFERLVFFLNTKSNGISHVTPDYASVANRGLADLEREALERRHAADTPQAQEFFGAVLESLRAVIRFAGRYAQACRERAAQSPEPRARELLAAAAALEHVPARPARTLHEALQSVWITQVALHQENTNAALSFGRLDQVLYPAFAAERDRQGMDLERACELIGSFFLKLGDHTILTPRAAHRLLGGASTNQAVTIGGQKPDGADAVNELTFIMLKTAELLALREPNVGARWHADTDPEYRRALIKSIYRTGAAPALYNDGEIVPALQDSGVALEHARDYGINGCVETASPGRTMGHTGSIMFNLASVLELALHDGVNPLSGTRIGPATGRLADIETYEDFVDAFRQQLEHMVQLSVDGNNRFARAHQVLHPTPLLSALIQGTFDSAKDVTYGGAMYNSSGVGVVGLADVADSLSALKSLVFGSGVVSPREVQRALGKDFEGYDKIRVLLKSKPPRYGTDDANADAVAARVADMVSAAFDAYPNPRGGRYHVGYWSVTMHAGNFACTGALPNGRRRGEALASGATPVSGAAHRGPTASLASTARLRSAGIANCIANNHKFSRTLFRNPEKLELFEKLVNGYFRMGGMQVQFNVHDAQTLLHAQQNPDAYRDLLVRVSGYSAYFCDLNRQMQDEIIHRTEHAL